MSDTPLWMPLYVADYLQDTRHLTTCEHGAYMLLLFHAWTHSGQLPIDPERLRRISCMSPKEWKASWPTLREFFVGDDTGYRHKRVDNELARAGSVIDKRRAAANARWSKQKDGMSNANAYTDALPMECQPQPQPQPQEERHLEQHSENTSLHPRLAFSGRVIRLNQRDFDEWRRRNFGIPDLAAELGALDDWLRDQDEAVRKKWFHVVSAALTKKHQAAVKADDSASAGQSSIPI